MTDSQNSRTWAADILVVDDTIASLKLLTEILTKEGYRVRPAEGPRVALQSALAHPPGLILLDVRMPDMDGFEVCRRLKQDERTRDVPVIFVSALQDVTDRVRGFEAGGVDFVSKPIEEAEVLARVKTHLQLRAMQLHLEELVVERTAELRDTNKALRKEIQERRAAQQALGESEEKYRAVVEQSREGILVIQDGERKFHNRSLREISGYSAEEYALLPFLSLVHPDDLETVENMLQGLFVGQEADALLDFRIMAKSGELKWLSLRGSSIVWQGRPAAMFFLQDITGQKRTEAALVASEARFRAIFDHAPMGIAVAGSDSFVIDANDAFQQMVGYTSQELRELDVTSLSPEEDNGRELPLIQDVLQGSSDTYALEKRFRHRDGREIWTETHSAAVRDENGEVRFAIGIVQDITQRKEAQSQIEAALQALRESEDRYRTLVEQAQDGIAVLQDNKVRFANSYVAGLIGYSVQEMLDTPFEAYLTPDRVSEAASRHRKRIMGESVPPINESTIQHRDGSRVEVEFNAGLTIYDGRPANLVFVRDISERLKARRELEASQRLLSLVIDNVPALVSYVDRNQRYRFVNRRYEDAYGIPLSEFGGKPVRELLGPQGYAAAEPQIAAALAGERMSYEDVFAYPDRAQKWMSIDYVPDRDPAGNVVGFVGLIRDITESKEAEAALRESEEKLRAIYEAIPVAAYTWQREDEDFILVDYNEMAAKVTEGRVVDLIGAKAGEVYRDRPEIPAAMARCSAERLTIEEEMDYELITTGKRRHLNVKYAFAPPDLVVVHTEDITARRRAEEELKKGKERLEEAQRTAQIGDWEYDIQAGKMTWSDEMYRIFGLDPQMYVPRAKSDEELCHPDDAPALRRAFEHFFATGEPLDIDYRIVTPQGVVKACRRRARLIVGAEGAHLLAIGTTEDISQRKQAEEQIQEYQTRLQALASQLTLSEERERRRIARELHDEVGQTLAFVRTGLASARKAHYEAQREAILDEVSESLRQAIRDTRDLVFDLSSPLMNELGLGAALREWLEDQVGNKHGIQTEFIYDGKRFPLDDDMRAILFRCTRELLTNVVKHSQAGWVTVRLEDDGPLVRIVVEDDGVGYAVEPTLDAMERDAGFGLFSIQERMADLGGSLEIRTEPGRGCTAVLTAPATID